MLLFINNQGNPKVVNLSRRGGRHELDEEARTGNGGRDLDFRDLNMLGDGKYHYDACPSPRS